MPIKTGILEAEREFFTMLEEGNAADLAGLLTDDFLLIDVMSGSEVSKLDFLSLVGSGQLKFESIKPTESHVRFYNQTAIVTGRSEMGGRIGVTEFTLHSRYTHVYIDHDGHWLLATAQGTQVAAATVAGHPHTG